jgi:hypothetical protein
MMFYKGYASNWSVMKMNDYNRCGDKSRPIDCIVGMLAGAFLGVMALAQIDGCEQRKNAPHIRAVMQDFDHDGLDDIVITYDGKPTDEVFLRRGTEYIPIKVVKQQLEDKLFREYQTQRELIEKSYQSQVPIENKKEQLYFEYYDVGGTGKYELSRLVTEKSTGEKIIEGITWLGIGNGVTQEQAYAYRGINAPIRFKKLIER